MTHRIETSTCTACGASQKACPNEAISHKGKLFRINSSKCKDCVGDYDEPQCEDVCPSGSCTLM